MNSLFYGITPPIINPALYYRFGHLLRDLTIRLFERLVGNRKICSPQMKIDKGALMITRSFPK
jgi:hypothetical protein